MKPGEPLVAVQLDQLVATLRSSPYLLELRGAVRHYAWGGTRWIPELLGVPNPAGTPFAEWWVGSHPSAPSTVRVGGEWLPITDLVRLAGDGVTGIDAAGRFGPGLPYLAKVLDVRAMLSIQAHPNRAQAEEGFAREQAEGLPLDAPNRNYRDPNHKPEASVAITDFWMLYGFKPPDQMAASLDAVPELAPVFREAAAGVRNCGGDRAETRAAIRRIWEAAMQAPAADVDSAVGRLTARLEAGGPHAAADKSSAAFWARRAVAQHPPRLGRFDRGLLSIFLLNLLHLAPGEAVFIPAGIPHAYLEGVAVEVMANSDNVLRGGLTPKHVDPAELMRVLSFEPTCPAPLVPIDRSAVERIYPVPADEFEVARLALEAGQASPPRTAEGADLLVAVEGQVTILGAPRPLDLARGGAALATHGLRYHLRAERPSVLFRIGIPSPRR